VCAPPIRRRTLRGQTDGGAQAWAAWFACDRTIDAPSGMGSAPIATRRPARENHPNSPQFETHRRLFRRIRPTLADIPRRLL
jgi:hypothetical protein